MPSFLTPQLFGILSLVAVVSALVPYYIDIIRGNTKPQRAAMCIFAVLSAIAFFGQWAEGAEASLWFAGALLCNQIVLCILSFKYGMGGLEIKDKIAFILAGLILIGWYYTQSAVVALVLVTVVNTIAKILVMIKVYKYPNTEMLYAWNMSIVAALLGALAVGTWDWVLLLVPLHNAVTVALIALIIVLRRQPQKVK